MTNFEKWVASLTPELVARVLQDVSDIKVCKLCPYRDWTKCPESGGCDNAILAYFAEEVAE